MKMHKKFVISILSLLWFTQSAAGENDLLITNREDEMLFQEPLSLPDPVRYKKICPSGSFSLSSGPGISWRSRNNFKGRAMDVKVGIGSIPGFSDGSIHFRSVSWDYNWRTFYSPSENSPYLSWGLGAAVLLSDESDWKVLPIPYAPLRAGYQFKYGFIDVGAKMALWIPIPEVRGGLSFEF